MTLAEKMLVLEYRVEVGTSLLVTERSLQVSKKFILFILLMMIIPIVFHFLMENHQASHLLWSFMLIPGLVLVIIFPTWKAGIIISASMIATKYSVEILHHGLNGMEWPVLLVGTFVNVSVHFTFIYFRIQNYKLFEEVQRLLLTDSLTGIYNRRYFDLRMEKLIPQAKQKGAPLTIMMLDIDHFKQVNDTHGHQFGDDVLKRMAQLINSEIRKTDALVRMGGEEFAVLLPETKLQEGILIANRLRQLIEEAPFVYDEKRSFVTISIGIGLYAGEPLEQFIEKVDQALYEAKKAGRNQVAVSS